MTSRHWLRIGCLTMAACLSGCVMSDPWQVWRYGAGFNANRALSAQIVFYDHLPPPPVRTRLTQWGYNVAPGGGPMVVAVGTDLSSPPLPPPPGVPPAPGDVLPRPQLPPMPLQNSNTLPPRRIVPPDPSAEGVTQRPGVVTPTAAWLFAPNR